MGLGDFFKGVGDAFGKVGHVIGETNDWIAHHNPGIAGLPTLGTQFTVEQASSGLKWVRDNAVSQPLSTGMLQSARFYQDPSKVFSAGEWAKAWHAAEHLSPGQVMARTTLQVPGAGLSLPTFGFGANEAQKMIDSPLEYYKPGAAYLPPDFDKLSKDEQQRLLQQAGMPAIGNRYIEGLRHESGLFKYASGSQDFLFAWYTDPAIVGGKALGAVRAAKYVKTRPLDGWSGADIDKLLDHSTMRRARDFLWENRENPALINNLQMAKNSAMGPRFGAIVSQLKSPEEVDDLLRVGMGDTKALQRLQQTNALAAGRVVQGNERLAALDLMRGRYRHMPAMERMVEERMSELSTRVNQDRGLVERYQQILDHSEELDKIYLARSTVDAAVQRTVADAAYRTGVAKGRRIMGPVRGVRQSPGGDGWVKEVVHGLGDFWSMPVTVVRSLHNARPNGYMRIDDIDETAVAELRGHVARIPGVSPAGRQNLLNQYLKTTTEAERLELLDHVDTMATAKIAEKYGMDPQAGVELYRAYQLRRLGGRAQKGLKADTSDQRFSAAYLERPGAKGPGDPGVLVDEFSPDGARVVVHPPSATRLANDHVMTDLDVFDKVLSRHSSALSALRTAAAGNTDWIVDGADYLTHMFKFSVLARLGYIPRIMGDDLAGQWAAVGGTAMAMRVGVGVRNGATNLARAAAHPWQAAKEETAREGLRVADEELTRIEGEAARLRAYNQGLRASNARDLGMAQQRVDLARDRLRNLPTEASQAQVGAAQKLFDKRVLQLQQAQTRASGAGSAGKMRQYIDLEGHRDFLQQYRDLKAKQIEDIAKWREVKRQVNDPVTIDGISFPAPFAGKEGEMYEALASGDEALGQLLHSNRQLLHGHLVRSFNHGGKIIRAGDDEAEHAVAWSDAINKQIMQDPLSRLAVQGRSVQDMERWLKYDAAGQAYMKRVALKFTPAEELANRAKAEVDQYLPYEDVRAAALEGSVTPEFLKEAVPHVTARPQVHTGQVGMDGQLRYRRAMDRVIDNWFNVAANIPAKRMSRHPLFNQLYDGHLKKLTAQRTKQAGGSAFGGPRGWTVEDVDSLTTTARRLALRDMRKLVFDIAHSSDAAAAMRFISPFFSATAEAFQRWGRIIADKPQIVGYGYNFFNLPLALGHMQDADGNSIMPDGTAATMTYPNGPDGKPDYTKGQAVRRMVPKGERYIVGRVPKWLASSPVGVAFGVEQSSGKFALSQNSMNMLTQGDPWFNPGVGPIVQIPVNEFVKDKPQQAELARHLGILPFGPQSSGPLGTGPLGRASSFITPATVKNFLTAFDTSDERYQAVKLHIMQRAAYEHENLGKPMPSAQRIADMTRDYWLFSAGSAFLQPMATQRKDAYQLYRDQYNALRRINPLTADDEFISRFGESYFVFAQAQSENKSGIPATMKATELQKQWAPLLAEHPELGALIIGPEGNGPFSPEAYAYQLNHPLEPGGAEMQRTKMSATEAMRENQRRLGWAQFTAKMNGLTAELHSKGFASFQDKGAEVLRTTKRAVTMLFGDPLLPDGSKNPYYNAAWSEDFYSLDAKKTDRMVSGLADVAFSPLAQQKQRSDLRVLQEYLTYRKAVVQLLSARKAAGGAQMLGAKANTDLARIWGQVVDQLIEKDTRFGDLHHRYLSRDLGVDVDEEVAA